MVQTIVSGGQTGADRAALDACLALSFATGGYCPAGRKAEDGVIDARYPLIEMPGGYRQRTKKNVETADLTVIFYQIQPSGGTEQTLLFAIKSNKPYKLIDTSIVTTLQAAQSIKELSLINQAKIVNIAGPRHSGCPSIYAYVKETITLLIQE